MRSGAALFGVQPEKGLQCAGVQRDNGKAGLPFSLFFAVFTGFLWFFHVFHKLLAESPAICRARLNLNIHLDVFRNNLPVLLRPLCGPHTTTTCQASRIKNRLPMLINETVELFETIRISSGLVGLEVELSPYDLAAIPGRYADIVYIRNL